MSESYMTNFTGDDMPGQISYASDSPESKKNKDEAGQQQSSSQSESQQSSPEQQSESGQQSDSDSDSDEEDDSSSTQSEVPDGTSAEVMRWVGDDQEKAQAAIEKEQADEKPRQALIRKLQKVVEG